MRWHVSRSSKSHENVPTLHHWGITHCLQQSASTSEFQTSTSLAAKWCTAWQMGSNTLPLQLYSEVPIVVGAWPRTPEANFRNASLIMSLIVAGPARTRAAPLESLILRADAVGIALLRGLRIQRPSLGMRLRSSLPAPPRQVGPYQNWNFNPSEMIRFPTVESA